MNDFELIAGFIGGFLFGIAARHNLAIALALFAMINAFALFFSCRRRRKWLT